MKLHPLSIPYRASSRVLRFGWALVVALFGASSGAADQYRWYVLAGIGVLVIGALAYQVAEHERFEYALTATTLDIDSGVFSRRAREIPLARVQNVDVSQNVVQRLLGIATVNVETAGGGETEAVLECVGTGEADRLQTEIRQRKRDLEETDASDERPELGTDAGTRGEVVFELDDHHLVLLSVLSFDTRLISLAFGAQPFLWPVLAPVLGQFVSDRSLVLLFASVAVVTVLAVLLLWAVSAARAFTRFYGFRLVRDGDDLRYERGLLQRYSGTIPLEKLQTLVVTENLLMRRFDYAALRVETAGYAPGSDAGGGSATVVPLAARDAVLGLGRRLEPFQPPTFEHPPERAKRRYTGRYALAALALLGVTTLVDQFVVTYPFWWAPALLLPLAPLAARYKYVSLGYAVDDAHAFARRGFFVRETHVVPAGRVQTVVRRATIFQRRWRLADVVVDTAGSGGGASGDAIMEALDVDRATEIADTVTDHLRHSLQERSQRSHDRDRESRELR